MARSNPDPQPLPTEGGSYLLNVSTGEWVRQDIDASPAEIVTEPDDGLNSEAPTAGED